MGDGRRWIAGGMWGVVGAEALGGAHWEGGGTARGTRISVDSGQRRAHVFVTRDVEVVCQCVYTERYDGATLPSSSGYIFHDTVLAEGILMIISSGDI